MQRLKIENVNIDEWVNQNFIYICRLKGGNVNYVYEIIYQNCFSILKIYRHHLGVSNKVKIELNNLAFLNSIKVKCPMIYKADFETFETPYIIYKKIESKTLHFFIQKLNFKDLLLITNEIKYQLNKINTIPNPLGFGYLENINSFQLDYKSYLDAQLSSYISTAKINNLLGSILLENLENYKKTLILSVSSIEPRVTFIDLKPENIILNNRRYSGLIDFEFLCNCNPFFSWANLLLYLNEDSKNYSTFNTTIELVLGKNLLIAKRCGIIRALELLSYIKTTVIYDDDIKIKKIESYKGFIEMTLNEIKNEK